MSLPNYETNETNEASLNQSKKILINKFNDKFKLLPESNEETLKSQFTADIDIKKSSIILNKIEILKKINILLTTFESYIVQKTIMSDSRIQEMIDNELIALSKEYENTISTSQTFDIDNTLIVKDYLDGLIEMVRKYQTVVDDFKNKFDNGDITKKELEYKNLYNKIEQDIDDNNLLLLSLNNELLSLRDNLESNPENAERAPLIIDPYDIMANISIYNVPDNIALLSQRATDAVNKIRSTEYYGQQLNLEDAAQAEEFKQYIIKEYGSLQNYETIGTEAQRDIQFVFNKIRDIANDMSLGRIPIYKEGIQQQQQQGAPVLAPTGTEEERSINKIKDDITKIETKNRDLYDQLSVLERNFNDYKFHMEQIAQEIRDDVAIINGDLPRLQRYNIKSLDDLISLSKKVNAMIDEYYKQTTTRYNKQEQIKKQKEYESSASTSKFGTKISSSDAVNGAAILNKIILNLNEFNSGFNDIISNYNNINFNSYKELDQEFKKFNELIDVLKIKIFDYNNKIKLTSESSSLRPSDLIKNIKKMFEEVDLLYKNIIKLKYVYNPSRFTTFKGGSRNNNICCGGSSNLNYRIDDFYNYLPKRYM